MKKELIIYLSKEEINKFGSIAEGDDLVSIEVLGVTIRIQREYE